MGIAAPDDSEMTVNERKFTAVLIFPFSAVNSHFVFTVRLVVLEDVSI